MGVYGALVALESVALRGFEQLQAGESPTGFTGQCDEQAKFGRGEVNRLANAGDGMPGEVNHDVGDADDLRRRWLRLGPAQLSPELEAHFDWWRAYYHFARPHASLRQPLGDNLARRTRQRFRPRTPAQAAGLTDHRWTVQELLAYPAPPLKVG